VGAKGVKFSMRMSSDNDTMIVSGATASLVDSTGGVVQYKWTMANTLTYAGHEVECEFMITMSDNKVLKVPTTGYLKGLITDALK